jgi:stage II sporulation protein P
MKKSMSCLADLGFEGSDVSRYVLGESEKQEAWLVEAVPVLSYFSGNADSLSQQNSGEIQEFALLYSGKHSKGIWSGAAGDLSRGQMVFEALEQTAEKESDTAQDSETDGKENDSVQAGKTDGEESDVVQAEESDEETAAWQVEKDADTISAALEENEEYLQKQEETKESDTGEGEKKIRYLKKSKSLSYLLKNFYIVDSSTSIDKKVFDVDALLHTNVTMKKKNEPQILIYHTHGGTEAFADSKSGKTEESVIGVGSLLTKILTEQYGYNVIHDETEYDKIGKKTDRSKAYNQAYAGIKKTLKKYPSIQVVIDLHRDGVGNSVRRIATVNGEKTAQIMFFNGLSRNRKGDISYLKNDNLQANLAFSLQMKMKCMELYPGLAKPVYLKSYRYNLHVRKKSLLIELGNENNTLQEAKNAMEPLAKVLDQVLSGK